MSADYCGECGKVMDAEAYAKDLPACSACSWCNECNQPPHLCICYPLCGDHLQTIDACGCKP